MELEALSLKETGFGLSSRRASMNLIGILDDDMEFRQTEMVI